MPRLNFVPVLALLFLWCSGAHAQTFSNPTPLSTPDSGPANHYPSTILVSGVSSPVTAISVTIPSIAHFEMGQVAILLVSPSGGKVVLMQECGIGFESGGGVGLTFADIGAFFPHFGPFAGGTYRPCAYTGYYGDVFPAPAPSGPYGSQLNALAAADVNGTWSLYITDLYGGCCATAVPSGWSISFLAGNATQGFTYQGRLDGPAGPISGTADLRFRLLDAAGNPFGLPSTYPAVSVVGGVFTVSLNKSGEFGMSVFETSDIRKLEISARVPADPTNTAPFVTLSPPQILTATPFAFNARHALSAGTASTVASAPWTSVTGVPANVSGAFSPWSPAGLGINYSGSVGFGNLSPTAPISMGNILGDLITLNGNAGSPNFGIGIQVSTLQIHTAVNTQNINFGYGSSTSFTQTAQIAGNGNLTIAGNGFKPGGGSWATTSDARAKHDITPLSGSLDKLMHLRGVSFYYNDAAAINELPGQRIGFIAQEVEPVFPDWVTQGARGYKSLTIRGFEALAVEALRDLRDEKDRQIEALKSAGAAKQREIDELRGRLEAVEAAVASRPRVK